MDGRDVAADPENEHDRTQYELFMGSHNLTKSAQTNIECMTYMRNLGRSKPRAFDDFRCFWRNCWTEAKRYNVLFPTQPPVPALPRRMSKPDPTKSDPEARVAHYVVYEADRRTDLQKERDQHDRVKYNYNPYSSKDELFELQCRHNERVDDTRDRQTVAGSTGRSGRRYGHDPEVHEALMLEAANRRGWIAEGDLTMEGCQYLMRSPSSVCK